MVTEREEKLAAARKKLARFQQTKTQQRPTAQQPKLESIGRGIDIVAESSSNDSISEQATRNTSPDSINGHNLMYSNPTPTFEECDIFSLFIPQPDLYISQ